MKCKDCIYYDVKIISRVFVSAKTLKPDILESKQEMCYCQPEPVEIARDNKACMFFDGHGLKVKEREAARNLCCNTFTGAKMTNDLYYNKDRRCWVFKNTYIDYCPWCGKKLERGANENIHVKISN